MLSKLPWERYRMQARLIAALAHPIRLAIVELLQSGERCVCDIARQIGAERSNVSRHLALMYRAGVLESRKKGLQVFYSLAAPCVRDFLACAARTLEHHLRRQTRVLSRR